MQRLRRLIFPLAVVTALAAIVAITVEDSAADLENQVFTSRADRLRLIVPRGWRATDQPSYPGLLLWMARSQPQGQIALTAEEFNRVLYCSWPLPCRQGDAPVAAKYACALRSKLAAQRMRVGPTQAGPKENDVAGLPSVWFEYDDGKHYVRQAVAMSSDRAFSLLLSAPTGEGRAAHTRAFEQALRTLQRLSPEETARAEGIDAGPRLPGDAAPGDAGSGSGAVLDAGAAFQAPPLPVEDPIGPCASATRPDAP